MSTNPFRRHSSLKATGASQSPNANTTAETRGSSPSALSLDTRVPSTVQKHVNFASPPAVPISPVSYPPSSPESSRQELFQATFPSPKSPSILEATDYSQALSSDPFAAEGSDDDDGVIEQALENARSNNVVGTGGSSTAWSATDNAVKETLGRFASGPRRPNSTQAGNAGKDQPQGAKSAMDVDAFKRMLLTGDRGTAPPRDTAMSSGQAGTVPVSDSGSSADTASISQHSIFENVQTVHEESPRTSDELESHEANLYRAGLGTISERGGKPAPPKSRRGKPVQDPKPDQAPNARFDNFVSSLSLPPKSTGSSGSPGFTPATLDTSSLEGQAGTSEAEAERRIPPALPLARRKSQKAPQKPALTRSSSSRMSVISDTDGPPSPATKPPPPPPTRRPTSTTERRSSMDVNSIAEDEEDGSSDTRPSLPHTPSYLKRMSQGGLPPPPPPPRRGRGSSRSSMDTTRPSMASLGLNDRERRRSSTPKNESRDLLADLAALQKEVDAAAKTGTGQ